MRFLIFKGVKTVDLTTDSGEKLFMSPHQIYLTKLNSGGKNKKLKNSKKSRKSIKNLKEKRGNLEDIDKYTIR